MRHRESLVLSTQTAAVFRNRLRAGHVLQLLDRALERVAEGSAGVLRLSHDRMRLEVLQDTPDRGHAQQLAVLEDKGDIH